MMKTLSVLALTVAIAPTAFAQTFADKFVDRFRVNFAEAVFLGGLARDFGLDDSTIFDLRNRYRYNDNELLYALYARKHRGASWDEIYRMRQRGMGWGQIAHSIGMHPGAFNKARKQNRWSNDRDMWNDLWNHRFGHKGTSRESIDWARRSGVSNRDIYIAGILSRTAGTSFQNTVNAYRRTRSWDGFSGGDRRLLSSSSSAAKKAAASSKGKGNSGNKGKGNSGNKGKGKGKGKKK